MGLLDSLVFGSYFIAVVLIGVLVAARSKSKGAADYFLASKSLPWYAVGASFIAANISSEHFIGQVGWGFLYGMAVANWEWGNVFTFSVLLGIFLPFYMRGNVTTMPEFLERRYNKICRYIYAAVSIVGLVIALLAGVMVAGATAMNTMFPAMSPQVAVLILALAAGIYTIYGGLLSAAWADVLQYCLLMIGGAVVTVFGLYYAGGFAPLLADLPEKFIMFYGPTHEQIPWTGFVAGLFSVGIWYNCANQFMVQRCLGARSEWDARMGVVMAGFSKAILPFIIAVPGVIAFYLFHDRLNNGDKSWPLMVNSFLPSGLVGLVLAGLASAILSTLSAVVNSTATMFTMDLWKPLVNPAAQDRELRLVGRVSGGLLFIGVALAMVFLRRSDLTVFELIQTAFWYMAAPIAAIFLLGIMWPGATPAAATTALILGFALVYPVRWLFSGVKWLEPYNAFTHHTFVIFCISLLVVVVVSFFTQPKPREQLKGVIWTKDSLGIPENERALNRGLRNSRLWWALMVIVLLGLYVYTNAQGSRATWLEAEKVKYEASNTTHARVQDRDELQSESFRLWTGKKQVIFTPTVANESITFELPVNHPGTYELAAVVTNGPEYGKFSAAVDTHPVSIRYSVTRSSETGMRYRVEKLETPIYDARLLAQQQMGKPASSVPAHVVSRIVLGEHRLAAGVIEVTLKCEDFTLGQSAIGVDQWILTRKGP